MVGGYKVSFVDDDGKYAVVKIGGKAFKESSTTLASWPRPSQPIILYQFNACPYCKVVREACNYLDLDVMIKPCPKDGKLFRPE